MALSNQGLIKVFLEKNVWILKKSETLDYSDYWQIGVLGLYRAAVKFRKKKGKFSSYAYLWIRKYITRAFQDQGFPVMRVPEQLHYMKDDGGYEYEQVKNALSTKVSMEDCGII